MLDFETPTYITAKESQQMQSGVSPMKHITQQTAIKLFKISSAQTHVSSFLLSKSSR